MKKIVLIAEAMEKGVGKHVIDLYKMLLSENVDITILYGGERIDNSYSEILNKNIKIDSLKSKLGFCDLKAYFEIRKYIKKIKPDIVHCHSSKAGLVGRIASKFEKVPTIIYSPHAYYFLKFKEKSLKRSIFIFAEKILSRFFTTKTITTSKGEDSVFEKYRIDKLNKKVLIEHGIDEPTYLNDIKKNEIRKKYNVDQNHILIGAMARFEEQKNPLETVKIMQNICENFKNVKCIFWGNGSLFEKAKEINAEKNNAVILPGEVSNSNECLNALDIYFTASLYEGLPYTLIQSLSLSLPVLASNVEGNKDCVYSNVNGYLFELNDVESISNKLDNMLKNDIYKEMGKASYEIFKARFSKNIMKEKYKELYLL